jgi:hypothetical protein
MDLSNLSFNDDYDKLKRELYRKNGFTEDDWHKAVRLTMSKAERKFYSDGIGYKKDVQMRKEKSARRAEKNGIRAQYSDEQLEAQLKNEDRWIADVFDTYDYDEEDMTR